jgi:hypothetical protein
MDLLKLFGFDFENIISRRKNQLEQQAQIDAMLKLLPCQNRVSNYLLEQRLQNRKMCREYDSLSLVEYYKTTLKHMNIIDTELKRVLELINNNQGCVQL